MRTSAGSFARLMLLLVVAGGFSPAVAERAGQAERGAPPQSFASLWERFRQSAVAEERQHLFERMMRFGLPQLRQLQRDLDYLLAFELVRYQVDFRSLAHRLVDSRMRGSRRRLEQLRGRIIGLVKSCDKPSVIKEVRRLYDELLGIVGVKADEIFAADPQLKMRRRLILQLASFTNKVRFRLSKLTESAAGESMGDSVTTLPQGARIRRDFVVEIASAERRMLGDARYIAPADRRKIARQRERFAGKLGSQEWACIKRTNIYRSDLGLNVLEIDMGLVRASRMHCQDMDRLGFFSHNSPVPQHRSPWIRAKLAGTTASAENLCVGVQTGEQAFWSWFDSIGHHRNMLGPHRRIGLGRHGKYWAEMFGR